MITDNEKFIEIQAILVSSNINTRDCAKINDLIIELSKENQELKKVIDKINHILNNQINYREFVDIVNAIEDVVKEVSE